MNDQITPSNQPDILVTGRDADPNLASLLAGLQNRGVTYETLLVGANTYPYVTWDVSTDVLSINGEGCHPRAIFIRHDMLTNPTAQQSGLGQRAASWFTTIMGWALAHPMVRILNRACGQHITNKLQVLIMARQVGLAIPSTRITNDAEFLTHEVKAHELVVKPVNGGDYTRKLATVLRRAPVKEGSLASPAIVQEMLMSPEVRVYRINGRAFPYKLVSNALDYRSTSDCEVTSLEVSDLPVGLIDKLALLMDLLQIDFGAADFKSSPQTGELKFLEMNKDPLFAAFDRVSNGRLSDAIIDFLCP